MFHSFFRLYPRLEVRYFFFKFSARSRKHSSLLLTKEKSFITFSTGLAKFHESEQSLVEIAEKRELVTYVQKKKEK